MKKEFSISKNGYSVCEVDAFIEALLAGTEARLTAQYNQIDSLIKKNAKLIDEVNRLRREGSNSNLIKQEFSGKKKKTAQIDVEQLADKYNAKNAAPQKAQTKTDDIAQDSGFNMEEALNPTDSLEELCRKLGMKK